MTKKKIKEDIIENIDIKEEEVKVEPNTKTLPVAENNTFEILENNKVKKVKFFRSIEEAQAAGVVGSVDEKRVKEIEEKMKQKFNEIRLDDKTLIFKNEIEEKQINLGGIIPNCAVNEKMTQNLECVIELLVQSVNAINDLSKKVIALEKDRIDAKVDNAIEEVSKDVKDKLEEIK